MSKVKCSKGLLKGLWTFFFSFLKVIHEAKWFVSQKIVQIFFSREATLGLVLSVLPSICLSHYFIKSHQESSRVIKSHQESSRVIKSHQESRQESHQESHFTSVINQAVFLLRLLSVMRLYTCMFYKLSSGLKNAFPELSWQTHMVTCHIQSIIVFPPLLQHVTTHFLLLILHEFDKFLRNYAVLRIHSLAAEQEIPYQLLLAELLILTLFHWR